MADWKLNLASPIEPSGTESNNNAQMPKFTKEYSGYPLQVVGVEDNPPPTSPNYKNVSVIVPYAMVDIIKADPDYLVWSEEEIIDAPS